jgi:DNA-binding FadR family transcriptional regulator
LEGFGHGNFAKRGRSWRVAAGKAAASPRICHLIFLWFSSLGMIVLRPALHAGKDVAKLAIQTPRRDAGCGASSAAISTAERTGAKAISMNESIWIAGAGDMGRKIHTRLADQIGRSIVRGEILPGQSLPSELRICGMMNVSRTAVREALRVLVGKGLLLSRPKSGTKVREPSQWNHLDPDILRWQFELDDTDVFLRKLFELRFAVEPAASAAAARACNDADVEAIRKGFDGMASAESMEAYVEADILFHKSIYQATHNQFFWPIAQLFELALHQSFRITAPGDHRSRAIAEHRALLEAIVARDPDEAHAATVQLLQSTTIDVAKLRGQALMHE